MTKLVGINNDRGFNLENLTFWRFYRNAEGQEICELHFANNRTVFRTPEDVEALRRYLKGSRVFPLQPQTSVVTVQDWAHHDKFADICNCDACKKLRQGCVGSCNCDFCK